MTWKVLKKLRSHWHWCSATYCSPDSYSGIIFPDANHAYHTHNVHKRRIHIESHVVRWQHTKSNIFLKLLTECGSRSRDDDDDGGVSCIMRNYYLRFSFDSAKSRNYAAKSCSRRPTQNHAPISYISQNFEYEPKYMKDIANHIILTHRQGIGLQYH